MKVSGKFKTKAKIRPSVMGFINILLGRPINIEINLVDMPIVFNKDAITLKDSE